MNDHKVVSEEEYAKREKKLDKILKKYKLDDTERIEKELDE